MESRHKRVLCCDKWGLRWKGTFQALYSPYQQQNAGRASARGASALDAICACCPSAHDLVSSAAISSRTAEGPRLHSWTTPVRETEMPHQGAAAPPHPAPPQTNLTRRLEMNKQELHAKFGPKLVGPLPGPKARAAVEADDRLISPSYTRSVSTRGKARPRHSHRGCGWQRIP